MLPLIAAGVVGVAIGSLFKENSKPETKVVTRYVQDNNSYHYTQNNYTYNVNVRNNHYKKKKTYHVSYHSHKKHKSRKYLLPGKQSCQQLSYNNNRLNLSKAALDNRANQLNPNNRLYQGKRWY